MRLKIMGLCLVAVFALTAMVSASASAAEPAFFECAKTVGGKFSDKKCSVPGSGKTGKYELKEGIGKGKAGKHAFKGKGGKATLHTPAVGGEVTCKSFGDAGEITSPTTEGKIISTFKTCESLKKKCASPGQKAGTIVTNALAGTLGYINKSKKEVGVDLKAEGAGNLAEFNCEGIEIETSGAVIGTLAPVNVFTKTENNVFAVTGEGFQQIKNFEGGPNQELLSKVNGSGPFPSGQQAEAANKGEELEVKA